MLCITAELFWTVLLSNATATRGNFLLSVVQSLDRLRVALDRGAARRIRLCSGKGSLAHLLFQFGLDVLPLTDSDARLQPRMLPLQPLMLILQPLVLILQFGMLTCVGTASDPEAGCTMLGR